MKLGVTGSRHIRPDRLVEKLTDFLSAGLVTELHHGDCTGWDEQAFYVAYILGIPTIAHPPASPEFRAYTKSDVIMPERQYLDRNKNIVGAIDFLIAAPDGPEKQRSGTWSTVRYAKKINVRGVVWL